MGPDQSKKITDKINDGDYSDKPGWVRMSVHPTMTNDEIYFITDAIKQIINNIEEWQKDYTYSSHNNEFYHISKNGKEEDDIRKWFSLEDKNKKVHHELT